MRNIATFLGLAGLLYAPAVLADDGAELDGLTQSDEDDELDDILGGDGGSEETVSEEREAVRSGDIDDRVGVQSERSSRRSRPTSAGSSRPSRRRTS
ncbi:MAG: hypothetical protein H6739_16220 [Alphaproteobacteria bacterium]|nr:hypothetical protein [Alphaproteobacteria bacterium]